MSILRTLKRALGKSEQIPFNRKPSSVAGVRRNLETLEQRILLFGDTLYDVGAAEISPVWFEQFAPSTLMSSGGVGTAVEQSVQRLEWKDRLVDVFSDEWIVQLTNAVTDNLDSLDGAMALLTSNNFEYEVLGGLGLGGQLLIHTPGADTTDVENWLDSNSGVAFYEPNGVLPVEQMPNDGSFSQLWGLHNTGQTGGTHDADIDAPEAWQLATGSDQVVVGIIDTGVDYTHPDLASNIWTNPGEIAGNGIDDDGNGFVDDIHGYDFVNNDGDPMDDNNHGTHVAGTIAGVANDGSGISGVNWSSSVMALKFLSAGGWGSTADAVRAVNYATMMRATYGVNIVLTNNSWGGGGYSQALVDSIAANSDAGMLFVAAAGNSSSDNDATPHYPSSYELDNIIAVAATDHNDELASFSSYGATSVDIAAPGAAIYSTVAGGGYASFSGTSMATPHVAGVIALAWAAHPGATAQQIQQAVLGSGDPIDALAGVVASGARLNARGTLEQLGMVATGSSPQAFSTILTPPLAFQIDFSYAVDAASVAPSDLTVNGIAADSVTLVDPDTLNFEFNQSPATQQGLQVINLSEGAVLRAGTGNPVAAWEATFFYDTHQAQVVSATPSQADLLEAAPTTIELEFDEPVDPGSVDAGDLTLDNGSVVSAELISPSTVAFSITGLVNDGDVFYSLPAASVTDHYGNPALGFAGSFTIDDPLIERYAASDLPLVLIDDGRVMTSTVEVLDSLRVVDLDVRIDVSHSYDWDLDVFLVAPDGTRIELFSAVGGSGKDFTGTILDDEAAMSIRDGTAPFAGKYRPEGSLSDFDGLVTAGTWTLEVLDRWPGADSGTLDGWELIIEHQALSVVGIDPAADSATATAASDFTIDFSHPFEPSSVSASDFRVNGVPADEVHFLDTDSLRFVFNTTPVTNEGMQLVELAAGSIDRIDSPHSVSAFQSTFFFDLIQLDLSSTAPADGETVAEVPGLLVLEFNEPIDFASVDLHDLVLNYGHASSVSLTAPNQLSFTLSDIRTEGEVTFEVLSGSIRDAHGSPGYGHSGSFTIDDPAVEQYLFGEAPVELLDNDTVLVTFEITDSFQAGDVVVELDITHTFDSDLDVFLVSPDGTNVELFSDVGGSGNGFTGTILADDALTSVTSGQAPFTGRYRPEAPLALLREIQVMGTWTLQITDDYAWDSGQLDHWALTIERLNHAPVLEPMENQALRNGVQMQIELDASDADLEQTLSYSLIEAPAGAEVDPATGLVSWTPDETGTYLFVAAVTDPYGQSDSHSFHVVVNPSIVNRIHELNDQTLSETGEDRYDYRVGHNGVVTVQIFLDEPGSSWVIEVRNDQGIVLASSETVNEQGRVDLTASRGEWLAVTIRSTSEFLRYDIKFTGVVGRQGGDLLIRASDGHDVIRVGTDTGDLHQIQVTGATRHGTSYTPAILDELLGDQNYERIRMVGGGGDDWLAVGRLVRIPTLLNGGPGNDSLFGGSGPDVAVGLGGNNLIVGGAGNDVIRGGGSSDSLFGGPGEDTLIGRSGDDSLDGADGNDLIYAGGNDDTVVGGSGSDRLIGHSGNDWIEGRAGSDTIQGGAGNDILLGGGASDNLDGQSGDDLIIGGANSDRLRGRSGNDLLLGSTFGNLPESTRLDELLRDWQNIASDARFEFAARFVDFVVDDRAQDRLIGGDNPDLLWLVRSDWAGQATGDITAFAV